jgi:hypothetical protein
MRAQVPFTLPSQWGRHAGGCGCGCCGVKPYVRRGLNGLGAVDLSQYNLLQQYLQAANANLNALQASYAANPSAFDSSFGPALVAAQNEYTELLSAYAYAYALATGNDLPMTGTGLYGLGSRGKRMGLGQFPVLPVIYAGMGIATLISAALLLNKYIGVLQTQAQAALANAQAQIAQQSNLATAQTNLANAQASGDTEAAQQWQDVIDNESTSLALPASSSSVTSWLESNWLLVAAGLAAYIVLKDVL